MNSNPKFLEASVRLSDLHGDDDQDQPQQRRAPQPGSFASVVAALKVGETATKSMSIPLTDEELPIKLASLPEMRERLANNITPAVTRAKRNIRCSDYTTEVTQVLTPKGRVYVVAFVTRIA